MELLKKERKRNDRSFSQGTGTGTPFLLKFWNGNGNAVPFLAKERERERRSFFRGTTNTLPTGRIV